MVQLAGPGVRWDVGVGWGRTVLSRSYGMTGSGAHQRRAGHHHADGRQPAPPEQPPPVDTTYGIRVHDHDPLPIDKRTVAGLLRSMPPLKTEDCCGGVCDFRYARDTSKPRHQGTKTFRRLRAFEALLAKAHGAGSGLASDMSDGLAAGGLAT